MQRRWGGQQPLLMKGVFTLETSAPILSMTIMLQVIGEATLHHHHSKKIPSAKLRLPFLPRHALVRDE
jgi:hypothetical protein